MGKKSKRSTSKKAQQQPRQSTETAEAAALLSWLRSNGAVISKVQLAAVPGSFERRVDAVRAIRSGDEVVRIPYRCCIPHQRGAEYPLGQAILRTMKSTFPARISSLSSYCWMAR